MPHKPDGTDRIVVHLPKQMTRLIEEYQIQLGRVLINSRCLLCPQ
jgi:hypothetical protein